MTENYAYEGSIAVIDSYSKLTLKGCKIKSNFAYNFGTLYSLANS